VLLLSLIDTLNALLEDHPMKLFEEASKITEAYCIEHNLPCRRLWTHEELADAFEQVRQAHAYLYGPPAPAEAVTDEADYAMVKTPDWRL
jgi:hypothetical protein